MLLGAGGVFHFADLPAIAAALWAAAGVLGAVWSATLLITTLRHGRVGVDAIATIAIVGALLIGELFAAALVTLMLATGRLLEDHAAGRARWELAALVARAPVQAQRYSNGVLANVAVEQVRPGDLLLVRPGEIVPVDGLVNGDTAVLDESALTGEAAPVIRPTGDAVRSGVANAGGPFNLRATTSAAESTYAGIVRLVEQSSADSAPFVRMADRYATWFLPMAVIFAGAAWIISGDPVRAVAVLVVATPCPLILAAPVAFVSGLSRSAHYGVIVKGGLVLERLAQAQVLLLDKTGTLTAGHPTVASIVASSHFTAEDVLTLAASLDQVSPHVLAAPIVRTAHDRGLALRLPTRTIEQPGSGIRGVVGERAVAVGQVSWVVGAGRRPDWLRAAQARAQLDGDLLVAVSVDDEPAGAIVLRDRIRIDAARTIRHLRRSGVRRVVLVTGDRHDVADVAGAAIGADLVLAERLPEEKLATVRTERSYGPVLMVGDGINDAAALAAADVGVAMGARGTTVASEAADVVLTVDRLMNLGTAMSIARRSRQIAFQSVTVGMGLSLVAMGFAAFGFLAPAAGALLQEAIDVAVIVNALRGATGQHRRITVSEADAEQLRRFNAEHLALRPILDEIRATADSLNGEPTAVAIERLHKLRRRLVEELEPHELAEGAQLYPMIDRILGTSEATTTMSRAHVEIGHYIRRFCLLLDEIDEMDRLPEPAAANTMLIRRVLYGLHAICELHFAQEEEEYFSLVK